MARYFTDKELRKLCAEIGMESRKLGTYLEFSSARIDKFFQNHPGNVDDAIFEMLTEWQRTSDRSSGNRLTEMAKELREIGRADLAGDIASNRGFHGTTDPIPDPPRQGRRKSSRLDEPDSLDLQRPYKRQRHETEQGVGQRRQKPTTFGFHGTTDPIPDPPRQGRRKSSRLDEPDSLDLQRPYKRQRHETEQGVGQRRQKPTTFDICISPEHIQDIVETVGLSHLDEVYIRLGIADKDINNIKQGRHTSQEARNILFFWSNRKAEAATMGAMIEAMEKCPDCRASLNKLKRKWGWKGHVMISYKSDARARMLKLKDELIRDGFKVMMDVNNTESNIDDAMSANVEQAFAVLVCFSKKYQESEFCKKEAQYAVDQNKLIIPLKYEDYKPDGWLGIMINSLKYYDVQTSRSMKKELPDIVRVLGDRYFQILIQDTESSEPIVAHPTDDMPSTSLQRRIPSPMVIDIQEEAEPAHVGTDEPDEGPDATCTETFKMFTEADFVSPMFSKKTLIDSGGYGKVYTLTSTPDGYVFAGKRFHDFRAENRQELKLLKKLNHPNVVRLHGCIDDEDKDCFVIVMEKADMSLKDYLKEHVDFRKNKACDQHLLKKWMREVCVAIEYLHGRDTPVVHRDIRGANCLLFGKDEYLLKIADFGISRETDRTTETAAGFGHVGYKAPELCPPYEGSSNGKAYFSVKSDIYSLGMLFYEMYTGHVPEPRYDGSTRVYNQPIDDPLFEDIRDLLRDCWQKDHRRRPTIQQVLTRIPTV